MEEQSMQQLNEPQKFPLDQVYPEEKSQGRRGSPTSGEVSPPGGISELKRRTIRSNIKILLKCDLLVGAENSHEYLLNNDKKESAGQEDVGEVDHRGGLGAVHWTKPVRQSWWAEEGTYDARLFSEGITTVSEGSIG